jgi:hypothetical protein
MCPQLPRLSPEYSHKVGLQTVITRVPLQIRPVTSGGHAGPVTMGRSARGPLSRTRPHCGMTSSPVFVWCRSSEGCPCLHCPCLTSGYQRRLRARGGAFAFAPTRPNQITLIDRMPSPREVIPFMGEPPDVIQETFPALLGAPLEVQRAPRAFLGSLEISDEGLPGVAQSWMVSLGKFSSRSLAPSTRWMERNWMIRWSSLILAMWQARR